MRWRRDGPKRVSNNLGGKSLLIQPICGGAEWRMTRRVGLSFLLNKLDEFGGDRVHEGAAVVDEDQAVIFDVREIF